MEMAKAKKDKDEPEEIDGEVDGTQTPRGGEVDGTQSPDPVSDPDQKKKPGK